MSATLSTKHEYGIQHMWCMDGISLRKFLVTFSEIDFRKKFCTLFRNSFFGILFRKSPITFSEIIILFFGKNFTLFLKFFFRNNHIFFRKCYLGLAKYCLFVAQVLSRYRGGSRIHGRNNLNWITISQLYGNINTEILDFF